MTRHGVANMEWLGDVKTKMWHGLKVRLLEKYRVVDSAELIDHNAKALEYPKYTISIHFKKIFENENRQQEEELRILNKYFHKRWYKNISLSFVGGEGNEEYIYQ